MVDDPTDTTLGDRHAPGAQDLIEARRALGAELDLDRLAWLTVDCDANKIGTVKVPPESAAE